MRSITSSMRIQGNTIQAGYLSPIPVVSLSLKYEGSIKRSVCCVSFTFVSKWLCIFTVCWIKKNWIHVMHSWSFCVLCTSGWTWLSMSIVKSIFFLINKSWHIKVILVVNLAAKDYDGPYPGWFWESSSDLDGFPFRGMLATYGGGGFNIELGKEAVCMVKYTVLRIVVLHSLWPPNQEEQLSKCWE